MSASLDKKAVEKGGEVTLTWSGDASYAPYTSDWLGFFCSDDLDSLEDTEYVRPKRARSEREPERTNCGRSGLRWGGCMGQGARAQPRSVSLWRKRAVERAAGSDSGERRDQTQTR